MNENINVYRFVVDCKVGEPIYYTGFILDDESNNDFYTIIDKFGKKIQLGKKFIITKTLLGVN